jgi:hypothetical protein
MTTAPTATPLTLEIGRTYATRSGGCVTILACDAHDGRFFGDIINADGIKERIASFSESGRYLSNRETEFDIVALAKAGAA